MTTPGDHTSAIDMRDPAIALNLLSRIPLPLADLHGAAMARGARAAWAFPLAGAVLGLVAVAALALALALGLTPAIAAALALAVLALATGALHLDGLADCADGFWGGFGRARRLEIMADSRIGAFGVLALVFTLVLQLLALDGLIWRGDWAAALLAATMLSRAAMAVLMRVMAPARPGGLSARFGRPPRQAATIAAAIGAGAALLILGPGAALVASLSAVAAASVVAALATHKIGGQTGDVLGAAGEVVTLAVLLALSAYGA